MCRCMLSRQRIKRQQVLFVLSQTADRFWIAPSVLGFESCQVDQRLLLCLLVPNANEFDLHVAALASRNGVQDVALLVHPAALTRGGRKQVRDSREQSIMPIRHEQIQMGCAS